MILCISPNTNIERTWTVPGFQLHGVFRVRDEIILPSGKGINVARGIRIFGKDTVGMGFAAGHGGRLLAALAEREGIRGTWTWVEGEEREAMAVIDPESGGEATLISSPGPRVSFADWERLKEAVLSEAREASLICFSGSLPPGSPLAAFTGLIHATSEMKKPVWVDCQGEALLAALDGSPAGVKVNALEAGEAAGIPVVDAAAAGRAARALRERGAGQAIVTLGKQGALLSCGSRTWLAKPPSLPEARSSVGSGDAFMAGWLASLDDGLPPEKALQAAVAAGAANTLTLGGGRFTLEDFHHTLEETTVQRDLDTDQHG
jgi:1-phosphofructokinase family hexose kinase